MWLIQSCGNEEAACHSGVSVTGVFAKEEPHIPDKRKAPKPQVRRYTDSGWERTACTLGPLSVSLRICRHTWLGGLECHAPLTGDNCC